MEPVEIAAEESVRIKYVDPQGEREKRRLVEALRRGEARERADQKRAEVREAL